MLKTKSSVKILIRIFAATFLLVNTLSVSTNKASAFTLSDADLAMNSFNNAFYSVTDGKGIYKYYNTGGVADFWRFAEMIEMVEDAYERSGNNIYKNMINELYNGFVAQYGLDWTNNGFNDDIMWMVLACERAYQITGDVKYKNQAKYHFDQVYARGYDSVMGGGIWWTTDKTCKNSCINSPAAIAAVKLYQIFNDSTYLDKAKSLYSWERSTLFDSSTGAIWDSIHVDSAIGVDKGSSTYNQGTFIGAANELYKVTGTQSYYDDALKALKYTKGYLAEGGILVSEKYTSDAGGFKGIFCRWAMKFIKDNNLTFYSSWMQDNANAAWSHRRAGDNLMDQDWNTATPAGTMSSWFCSSGVVIMQVCTPGTGSGNRYANAKTEAESYNGKSGMIVEACPEGGQQLGGIMNNTYAVYNNMDMDGANSFQARIATDAGGAGSIEIRLDSANGPLIGTCSIISTEGYSNFITVSCPVTGASGVHSLYLVFKTANGKSYVCNLNWFKFIQNYRNAKERLEAENLSDKTGMVVEKCNEGGKQLGGITNNCSAVYKNIDFGTGVAKFQARVAVDASAGGSIEIRRDSLTGELLGTCGVPSTGGWTTFATVSCPVSSTLGVHDLYLVFKTASGKSYVCNLNWFTFGDV